MKLGRIGRFINDNKKTIILVGSFVTNAIAIVEAVRAGVKVAKKLKELPEDATVKDKAMVIATTPAVWGAIGTFVLSNGGYMYLHRLDVRDILTAGSAAKLLIDKNKAKDEAVKETVDEETATTIEKKTGEKFRKARGKSFKIIETGVENGTIFENEHTHEIYSTSKEWLEQKWTEFQRDMLSQYRDLNNRGDQCVSVGQFFEEYLGESTESWADEFGYTKKDLRDLRLEFSTQIDTDYGKYQTFRISKDYFKLPEDRPFRN